MTKPSAIYWENPANNQRYALDHLVDMEVIIDLKVDNQIQSIPVQVKFTNHCYTRGKKEGDHPSMLVGKAHRAKNGDLLERVFCPIRWEYSKKLPDIIKDISYKTCLHGSRGVEFIYRQDATNQQNTHEGWYLCIKLALKDKRRLQLIINSCHHRNNRPENIRPGSPKRFNMLVSEIIKKKKWSPEKQKPQ